MAQPVAAGFASLLQGMHAGVDPELLGESVYSRGINLSCRGGLVRTRPGFQKVCDLGAGEFQGMATWSLHDAQRLVLVKGGRVLVVTLPDGDVQDLGVLMDTTAQCYLGAVERYFLIQDGTSVPVVLQEAGGVVSVMPVGADPENPPDYPAQFVPSGYGFVFAHGRLHMSPTTVPGEDVDGRPFFISGDVMEPAEPTTCLRFIETDYWNEGGAHSLPLEMGFITGFGVLRNVSSGTGYGGLLVFAERGVSAFDVSLPRDTWGSEALGQVLYFGAGTRSPWAIVSVNGTVVYRAVDGLRIVAYTAGAKQSAGDTLANVVQSAETEPFFRDEPAASLPWVSMAAFDNRLAVTVGGEGTRLFKALVVLDVARVSELSSASGMAAYDGIWQVEGRQFAGVCSAMYQDRETLFCVMDDGWLWRLDPAATTDDTAVIRARLVSRCLFSDSGPALKRLSLAETSWRDVLPESLSVTLYVRPAGYPYWATVGTRIFGIGAGRHIRTRTATPIPFDFPYFDPASGVPLHVAPSFQFALEWTGHAVLQLFRAEAMLLPDTPESPCPETESVSLAAGGQNGIDLGEYLT